MPSSLIRGKYLVVKVESRTQSRIIHDGAVFQRDGVVVEVGPYAELQARHPSAEVLGSAEHVVMPGFVNGHHHVGLTPLQLGSPDHPSMHISTRSTRLLRCSSRASPPSSICTACASAPPPG